MNVGKTELKLRISGRKSGSLDLKHSLLICGKDESLDARRKKRRKKIPTLDFLSNGLPQSAKRACVHYTCTPVNKIHSPPSALSVPGKEGKLLSCPDGRKQREIFCFCVHQKVRQRTRAKSAGMFFCFLLCAYKTGQQARKKGRAGWDL